MHSNRALTSVIFQFVKLSKEILQGLYDKPNDELEWRNLLQLMCNLRQSLACSICGKFLTKPYTPMREKCHCICEACLSSPNQQRYNCNNCRGAFGIEDSFEENVNLRYTSSCFVKLCKLIIEKNMLERWPNLYTETQNGGKIYLVQLVKEVVQEGHGLASPAEVGNLGDKFRKRPYKEKEHYCRCGSGAKRSEGKSPGNLTCLGQRCACYKEGKYYELK